MYNFQGINYTDDKQEAIIANEYEFEETGKRF